MRFVTVRDLRSKSAEIWQRLARENEIVITSNGRPIALLTPVSEETLEESLASFRRARAMAAVEALQSRSIAQGTHRITSDEIHREIRAVRKNRSR